MAYTLGDLVSLVQQRVRDTGYSTSEIKQYINDTQNDVFNEYRLRFMEATVPYTTVANVPDITNGVGLPSDFLVGIDLINVTDGGQRRIPFKESTYLDIINTTTPAISNNPEFWYMYGQTPMLYPTINVSLSLSLRYYKMPVQLSDNADVPSLPYSFQELLVLGAAYRVLQVKDNYDQAGILQNKYDEILAKLVKQTAVKQVGTSSVQRINRHPVVKRNF